MDGSSDTVDRAVLTRAAITLFDEAYIGPHTPGQTWFADNEPDCGVLGTLENVDADEASRVLHEGEDETIAAHTAHLLFAVSLAKRGILGEAPAAADWSASWRQRRVNAEEWEDLKGSLRREVEELRRLIEGGGCWKTETLLTDTLAHIAHGAWHLGAIRQALGLVKLPRE